MGVDICYLLNKHLQHWRNQNCDDLVMEVEHCAREPLCSRVINKKDHCVKVFTRLMLRAQVCSAVQFLTNRTHSGGILSLDASTGEPGHSVLDTLREKHPAPGVVVESAFLLCDVLLPLIDLDITAEYVEHVAQQINSGICWT